MLRRKIYLKEGIARTLNCRKMKNVLGNFKRLYRGKLQSIGMVFEFSK